MQRSSVALDCSVDGASIIVRYDTISNSKLVASLSEAGSVGNIEVPFDSGSVMSWKAFAEGSQGHRNFLQCVAALEVLLLVPACCMLRSCPKSASYPSSLS